MITTSAVPKPTIARRRHCEILGSLAATSTQFALVSMSTPKTVHGQLFRPSWCLRPCRSTWVMPLIRQEKPRSFARPPQTFPAQRVLRWRCLTHGRMSRSGAFSSEMADERLRILQTHSPPRIPAFQHPPSVSPDHIARRPPCTARHRPQELPSQLTPRSLQYPVLLEDAAPNPLDSPPPMRSPPPKPSHSCADLPPYDPVPP